MRAHFVSINAPPDLSKINAQVRAPRVEVTSLQREEPFMKASDIMVADVDGKSARLTEMDALVAYLQVLGTLVDFKLYDDKADLR